MPEKEIVFGEKEAGKPYKSRYGAYVVLPNEKIMQIKRDQDTGLKR